MESLVRFHQAMDEVYIGLIRELGEAAIGLRSTAQSLEFDSSLCCIARR